MNWLISQNILIFSMNNTRKLNPYYIEVKKEI